jgi:hypothetical protein
MSVTAPIVNFLLTLVLLSDEKRVADIQVDADAPHWFPVPFLDAKKEFRTGPRK